MKYKNHIKVAVIIIFIVAAVFAAGGINIKTPMQYRNEGKKEAQRIIKSADSVTEGATYSPVFLNEKSDKNIKVKEKDKDKGKKIKYSEENKVSTEKKGNKDTEKKQTVKKDKQNKEKSTSEEKKAKKKKSEKNTTSTSNTDARQSSRETAPASTDTEKKTDNTKVDNKKDQIICDIEIQCKTLVKEKEDLEESIKKLIPDDGYILKNTSVYMDKESTVYDLLNVVCKAKNISLNTRYTPLYKTYYIVGINDICEKQAGEYSGWMYKLNGVAPDYGASACILKDGDKVEWYYVT